MRELRSMSGENQNLCDIINLVKNVIFYRDDKYIGFEIKT